MGHQLDYNTQKDKKKQLLEKNLTEKNKQKVLENKERAWSRNNESVGIT